MNKLLLIRFRALAASIREYISTNGIIYGKLFGFASGRERPAANGSGSMIAEMYQIANGISQAIDEILLHSLNGTSPEASAMVQDQHTEKLLMETIMNSHGNGSGHIGDIVFGRSASLIQNKNTLLGRLANVEHGAGEITIGEISKAIAWSVWIVYTQALITAQNINSGRPSLANVLNPGGSSFTENFDFAKLVDADTVNGHGSTLSKLVGNSNITTENPIETLMLLLGTGGKGSVSGDIQNLDDILLRTTTNLLSVSGHTVLELIVKSRGLLNGYLTTVGNASKTDSKVYSMTTTAKIQSKAGAILWQAPIKIEDTLYITSVYDATQTGSTICID